MAVVAMFAPYEPARAMARQVVNPNTGNVYYLNAQGAALVNSSDVAWFAAQGFSATPTAGTGQTVIYAPLLPQQQTAGPITNPNTGNTYVFNSAGAAAVANVDVPWFATQGFRPLPTPGTGNVVAYAPLAVGEGSSGPELIPNGNSYVVNAQGWAVVTSADAAWLATQGFSPSMAAPPVVFPPVVASTQATIAADFVGGQYWASAATQASFAAWLTAIGGTYTRASTATYLQNGAVVTAAANAPRFPTSNSGVAQGLRLTGAATNIMLHSGFDSGWSGSGTAVTFNATADPSGGTAGARAVPGLGNQGHIIFLGSITYTATTYTVSMFVKNAGYNFFAIDPKNNSTDYAIFDLTLGTTTLAGAVTAAGGIPLANGWVLCWLTLPMTAGGFSTSWRVCATNSIAAYIGDGTSGIFVWGAQIAATAFPVDYVPTVAASVTQAADVLSFPFTQTTASVLVGTNNQNFTGAGSQRIVDITDGGSSLPMVYLASPTQFSNFHSAVLAITVPNTLGPNKIMVSGNPSSIFLTANGLTPVSNSGPFAVTPTVMSIGSSSAGGAPTYGNFSQLAIWNAIVASTADMQRLTT